MIDTLMALWNRGYGGRGMMVSIAFILICISISLLLVTVGSSWLSFFSQGPPPNQRSVMSATDLTATAQSNGYQTVADNTATILAPTVTPTAKPTARPTTQPCTTYTGKTPSGGGSPGKPTVTPTSTHPHPTATIPLKPTSTPGVTPTVTSTPIVTPTDTPTPIGTITPTPTDTPIPTVTITPTPTVTMTPIATITPTPTVTMIPTPTPTIIITPITPIVTLPPMPTETATEEATPTDNTLIGITGTSSAHLSGGTPLVTGTSTVRQQGGTSGGTGCRHTGKVGDSLDSPSSAAITAALERNLWLILGGSTLGTVLFYVGVYVMRRKKRR